MQTIVFRFIFSTLIVTGLSACGSGGGSGNNSRDSASSITGQATSSHTLQVDTVGTGRVFDINANIDCGSNCQAVVEPGTEIVLISNSEPGNSFVGWSGACNDDSETCTVKMDANKSVTANYVATTSANYQLNLATDNRGEITSELGDVSCSSDCSERFETGRSITLIPTAATGYRFSHWQGDCSGAGDCSILMNSNKTVAAVWAAEALALSTTVRLTSDVDVSPTANETITFGLPLPQGVVRTTDDITVTVNGREQPIYIEPGLRWHWADNSLRSVSIQLQDMDMTSGDVVLVISNAGRTIANDLVEQPHSTGWTRATADKDSHFYPRILAIHDPEYLSATGLIRPYVASKNDAFDRYIDTQFERYWKDFDFAQSKAANWLFDRTTTLYKYAMRTGRADIYAEAFKSYQFWQSKLKRTGNADRRDCRGGFDFNAKVCDQKYIYAEPFKLHWALTGDNDAFDSQLVNDVAETAWQTAGYANQGLKAPLTSLNQSLSERGIGLTLLTLVNAYEITGDEAILARIKTGIDNIHRAQYESNPDGLPMDGSIRHSWHAHEGNAPYLGKLAIAAAAGARSIVINTVGEPELLSAGHRLYFYRYQNIKQYINVVDTRNNSDGSWTITLDEGLDANIDVGQQVAWAPKQSTVVPSDRAFSPWMIENISDALWQVYGLHLGESYSEKVEQFLTGAARAIALHGMAPQSLTATTRDTLATAYNYEFVDTHSNPRAWADGCSDNSPVLYYFGSSSASINTIAHFNNGAGKADQHLPETLLTLALGLHFERDVDKKAALAALVDDVESWISDSRCDQKIAGRNIPWRAFNWQHRSNAWATKLWVEQGSDVTTAPTDIPEPSDDITTTSSSVALAWRAISDASYYQLSLCASAGGGCGVIYQGSEPRYTQTDLAAATQYHYAIRGCNAAGCSQVHRFSISTTAASETTYRLNILAPANGVISSTDELINCGSNCSADYDASSRVTLVAVADEGYQFDGWAGRCLGAESCALTIDNNYSVSANFSPIAISTHRLSVNTVGNGTVRSELGDINCQAACNVNIEKDRGVSLVATAAEGFVFSAWSGACSGTGDCVLTLSEDRQVTANFIQDIALNPGQIFLQSRVSDMLGSCHSVNSFGVHYADLNFDGHTDMFTIDHSHKRHSLVKGEHCVWMNDGNGVFSHDDDASNSLSEVSGISCTWTAQIVDFNGDAKPDIWCRGSEAKSDYYENITANPGDSPRFKHTDGWLGEPDGKHPGGVKDTFLFADFNGDGSLERLSREGKIRDVASGELTHNTGLDAPDWLDMNGDGWPDIWSPTTKRVLRNQGDGSFSEVSYDEDLSECYYTGAVFHNDYDKDGDIDILCLVYNDNPKSDLVILRNDGNFNFSNAGATNLNLYSSNYRNIALTKGLLNVIDFDNDSLLDVMSVSISKTISLHQQTSPGVFEYIADDDFISDATRKYLWMMSAADYNNDGLLDVAVNLSTVNETSNALIFSNETRTDNHYIGFLLRGDAMGEGRNVNGVGTHIIVTKPGSDEVINTYYVSNSSRRSGPNFVYHLGLGIYDNVDVTIKWPNGFETSQTFSNVSVDQNYRVNYVDAGNDTMDRWSPGQGH